MAIVITASRSVLVVRLAIRAVISGSGAGDIADAVVAVRDAQARLPLAMSVQPSASRAMVRVTLVSLPRLPDRRPS
ncbi:MAG: hypothetical protein MZV49_16820 [Rhodopseudomonas palustris]|nr:hypothetical protein [Rhodopseudomonas palustris]